MRAKWNLWSIKSPWLRIPMAWLFAVIIVLVAAPIAALGAVLGGIEGARDTTRQVADWRDIWHVMTSTGTGK
jgi:hypothetical protein